jgi:hypothetical protein
MLESAKELQEFITEAKTAETSKRTARLSWMTESENHVAGAEPGDAASKDESHVKEENVNYAGRNTGQTQY